MPLALRIGRSTSIWEDGSDEEIARKEFRGHELQFDERPSVYAVEPGDIVRATAEHVVQIRPKIQKSAVELDLTGLGALEMKPAFRQFDFTNAHHAEIVLVDQAAVLRAVKVVRSDRARRLRRDVDAIERYIIKRCAELDAEWAAFLCGDGEWQSEVKKWLKKARP